MVFKPGQPRGPATVPNSFIVSVAADANFNDMVSEIDALIKKEGREKDVTWGNKMASIGVGVLNCDDDFAAKVKKLPYVGAIEPNHRVYIQKNKPRGPGFNI